MSIHGASMRSGLAGVAKQRTSKSVKPYYEHGGIAIYHGDCREVTAWLVADVLVTDPPYGCAFKSGWSGREIHGDDSTAVRDVVIALWGKRPALVFGRWDCPHPSGTRMLLTWDKGDSPGMGDLSLPWGPTSEEVYVLGSGFKSERRVGSVLRYNKLPRDAQAHPHEKPVKLLTALLSRCPSGTISDPFMGSGTTLRAAKDLGRRAIGIEIEERYCEIAAKRLAQEVLF